MNNRILVIGLDGADRKALITGINSGRLETMRELATTGTLTHLEAPQPPITPVSTASILTGNTPERHGIHGFERRQEDGGGYVGYTDIRGKTLFDHLSDAGKHTISINLPMTSPPPETDGAVVSGFPIVSPTLTHPPQLKNSLPDGYRTEPDPAADLDAFTDQVFDLAEHRFTVARDLIDSDWDVFMLMFTGDARLQHFIDDEDTILDFYEQVDTYLASLLDSIDDEPHILIISDHGFYPVENTFNVQKWLEQEGYLVTEKQQENGADLYGQLDTSGYDREQSTAWPTGAYMPGIHVNDRDTADAIREQLLDLEHEGRNVFIDVTKHDIDDGILLIPEPRRGFNHRASPEDSLFLETDEVKTPDSEGVLISSTPLLQDHTPRSIDIPPTLLDLLEIDRETSMDGTTLLDT